MISRDVAAASGESWDLVIIGGGVYGIMSALEAIRWGRRPLVLEMNDFGGATSSNSLCIIHGGLRYLQTGDLKRFHESVAERSWFLATFPDLVQPLECVMPLYNQGLRRRSVMRVALMANDFLSRRRNDGLTPDRALGTGGILSPAEIRRRFPAVPASGLVGGAVWFDAAMTRFQRVLIETLHWARLGGALALNYVRADRLLLDPRGGRVTGVVARDLNGGKEFEVRAPVVLNCTGPWAGQVARQLGCQARELFVPSLAFNLLLAREPLGDSAIAIGPRARGARTYFMYPWGQGTLVGTYHAPWNKGPDEDAPPQDLVDAFLADLNAAIPGWGVEMSDVRRVHWGLMPAQAPGTVDLAVRGKILDHGAEGGPAGLHSVVGVKFTTARRVAEDVMRRIFGPLAPDADGLPPRPAPIAVPSTADALAIQRESPEQFTALVRQLVLEEAVTTAEDLVLRRTDWALDPSGETQFMPLVRQALHDAREDRLGSR